MSLADDIVANAAGPAQARPVGSARHAVQRRAAPGILAGLAALLLLGTEQAAHAAAPDAPDAADGPAASPPHQTTSHLTSATRLAVPATKPKTVLTTQGVKPATPSAVDELIGLNRLVQKGSTVTFPGPVDSLTQDIGGYRSTLAQYGIGVQPIDADGFAYNVLDNAHPRSPQAYDGQHPTYTYGVHEINFTFDTSVIGIQGGQVTFTPQLYSVSNSPDGPAKATIAQLSYYQSLFNDALAIKIGYGSTQDQFVGLTGIGGNPTLQTGGPASLIPVELGLAHYPDPAPFVTATVNLDNGWYDKAGVARSLSPDGAIPEARGNGIGLRFGAPDAKALVIDEVGLKRDFAPDTHQIWLRAGGIYNFSDYTSFDGKSAQNWGGYALVDYQIMKFDRSAPYRGFFIGGTAAYGTPQLNSYSQNYEIRVYTIGLLNSRPQDVDSIVGDFNVFSQSIKRRLAQEGVLTAPSQFNLGYAHTFHVIHGVYLSPGLGYSDHPSFTGRYYSSLNAELALSVIF